MGKRKDRERAKTGQPFRNEPGNDVSEVTNRKAEAKGIMSSAGKLIGFRGFLNPRKTEDKMILLRRTLSTVGEGHMRKAIMDTKIKEMTKTHKKADKSKTDDELVEELTKTIREDEPVLEFCTEMGMDLAFFEGMALTIIKGK